MLKYLSLGLTQSNDSKLLVKRIIIEKNNTQLEGSGSCDKKGPFKVVRGHHAGGSNS